MAVAGRRAAPCKAKPNKDPNKILIYCYLSPERERERGGVAERERKHIVARDWGEYNRVRIYCIYLYIFANMRIYLI